MYLDLIIGGIAIYFVVDFILAYRAAIGSIWQRTIAAARGSATILWSRFSAVVVAAAGGAAQLADVLNAPAVSSAITTYCTPKVVAIVMVASALVTEFARRRSLYK